MGVGVSNQTFMVEPLLAYYVLGLHINDFEICSAQRQKWASLHFGPKTLTFESSKSFTKWKLRSQPFIWLLFHFVHTFVTFRITILKLKTKTGQEQNPLFNVVCSVFILLHIRSISFRKNLLNNHATFHQNIMTLISIYRRRK